MLLEGHCYKRKDYERNYCQKIKLGNVGEINFTYLVTATLKGTVFPAQPSGTGGTITQGGQIQIRFGMYEEQSLNGLFGDQLPYYVHNQTNPRCGNGVFSNLTDSTLCGGPDMYYP